MGEEKEARKEKMAAISQIASGLAHEIKNPLNSLYLNTQILMREVSEKLGNDKDFYETLSNIKTEINRINNILEEFVKYARLPEPVFTQVNINRVIREFTESVSQKARDAGVNIELLLKDDIPEFKFDETQLKTVLMHLFQNAINAMDKGGVFKIETALEDREAVIYISDTGKGINEQDLKKIFNPFFSTREGALGLGLSIVHKIVENHDGRIECTSKIGKGTVFKILLPMKRT